HYSQLGKFRCERCGFARRPLDFRVYDVQLADGLAFSLDYQGKTEKFRVQYRGFYNIYNIVLSYSAAVLALGAVPDYQQVLAAYQPQIGRMEEFSIGKPVILNLAKNPAGFNQAISTVIKDPREKDLLIAINDNAQDGKDISWIWDVDFERLRQAGIRSLIAAGIRADDLMLRLKHAGFPEARQVKCHGLREAAQTAVSGGAPVCYVLVNYTAVFSMQDILKELEGKGIHGA
ncbi:MAG: MurT ligase domain-containing protein, partial [Clostridia bacterium]